MKTWFVAVSLMDCSAATLLLMNSQYGRLESWRVLCDIFITTSPVSGLISNWFDILKSGRTQQLMSLLGQQTVEESPRQAGLLCPLQIFLAKL